MTRRRQPVQLELAGDVALAPPDVKLTARQRIALEHIAAGQPVESDELGAFLHQDRMARGGRGHSVEERCDWCGREGRQMGDSLRRAGLVTFRRGAGWVLVDYRPAEASAGGDYDLATAPFPEGY